MKAFLSVLLFYCLPAACGWAQSLRVYNLNEHDSLLLSKSQSYYWQINQDSIIRATYSIDDTGAILLNGKSYPMHFIAALSSTPFKIRKSNRIGSAIVPGITTGALILAAMITIGTEADESPQNWIITQLTVASLPVMTTHYLIKRSRKNPEFNLRTNYLLEVVP